MSTVPANPDVAQPPFLPPETVLDYSKFVTEDDTPVDGIYSERQHRLLTDVLHASWRGPGEGRVRWVATNVGLFFSDIEPPIVPDVMVSLDVAPPSEVAKKENRSYFAWRAGKFPELTVEVVSNLEGGELTAKKDTYARIRIPHYIVWDPFLFLGKQNLYCFLLRGTKFVADDPWFPDLELGVTIWNGEYDGIIGPWLRWCDQQGKILPTGAELAKSAEQRAGAAEQRAGAAEQRADNAEQRAAKLAEKLRALGIDPDQP